MSLEYLIISIILISTVLILFTFITYVKFFISFKRNELEILQIHSNQIEITLELIQNNINLLGALILTLQTFSENPKEFEDEFHKHIKKIERKISSL